MPQDASSLGETPLIRALVMGPPKEGKTVTLILSALRSFGSGYVICGSTKEHLRTAQIISIREHLPPWQFDVVKDPQKMEDAIASARKGVKDGLYHWVMLDDFNIYASAIEDAMEREHKGGYKTYYQYRKILTNNLLRLFDLKVHVFAAMHFYEVSEVKIEGQAPKKGRGVVPSLTGQAKQEIPGLFNQVVMLSKNRGGERVFEVNPEGVWGLGSHGLPPGTKEIPADLGCLVEALKAAGESK